MASDACSTATSGVPKSFSLDDILKAKEKLDARYIVPMTHEQREKVKALGGAAWVRRKIDAASDPKVKP